MGSMLLATAAVCSTQTLAAPNTAALAMTMQRRTRSTATFAIAFDAHTAAPLGYPQSGLAARLTVDGRTTRFVNFPLATKAGFVATFGPLRGTHELGVELIQNGRVVQTRTRCMRFT